MKDQGRLPKLSPRLGHQVRTNSEVPVGAIARDASVDYSHGSVITSSIHPEPHTHIEAVRYPTVITDVVSRKWVADVTSTEETSVQVQAAFTRALRDEGLLEVIEERVVSAPIRSLGGFCPL